MSRLKELARTVPPKTANHRTLGHHQGHLATPSVDQQVCFYSYFHCHAYQILCLNFVCIDVKFKIKDKLLVALKL